MDDEELRSGAEADVAAALDAAGGDTGKMQGGRAPAVKDEYGCTVKDEYVGVASCVPDAVSSR